MDAQAVALKRKFELLGDKLQAEELDGTVKLIDVYRRNKSSRTITAMRAAVVGDRKWLGR